MQVGNDTHALVTGASRGIGQALCSALAKRGATVGLLARSADQLEDVAGRLPGEHVALAADAGQREEVERAVAEFIGRAGGLDLVVANAGIASYGPFREQDVETAERMTRVNWLGTVYLVAAALPHLLDRAHGHVVIVSSGAGHRSFPSAAVYGATKSAQRGFGEALRHELSGTGVGLTMVYPGEIATSLHDHEKDSMPDWYRGGPSAAPAGELAEKVIAAVEHDRRAVNHPPLIGLLRALHGVSPRASDHLLRVLRGRSAAPRPG